MKSFHLKALCAGVLVAMCSSCEKKAENFEKLSDVKTQAIAEQVYPLGDNEMSATSLPKRSLPRAVVRKYDDYQRNKVKLIDTVCDEYIQETTKLDLSVLQEGQYVRRIRNSEFTITGDPEFNSVGFVRLAGGPAGWWAHWNYSPYTESEHPIVLFVQDRSGFDVNTIDIAFDKPVTTFGFEIAPNTTGRDYEVGITYNEEPTYRAPSLFRVTQTISSPSGARLIAVKSQRPFIFVSIGVGYAGNQGSGFAISNIRYALPARAN